MTIRRKKDLMKIPKNNFYPTYRADKGEIITKKTKINNIGIHSFIIQNLYEINSQKYKETLQRGLDYILTQSVDYNGEKMWKWIKDATGDYDFPPDIDDTARAIHIIELARKAELVIPEEYKYIDFEGIINEVMTKSGVKTFISRKKNSVCPYVNANVLNAYVMQLKNKKENWQEDKTLGVLINKLENIIKKGEIKSDYYISEPFFYYLISENIELFDSKIQKIVKERKVISKNNLEYAYESLKKINCDELPEYDVPIDFSAYPLYQHKRKNNVFGSDILTATTCYKAREKKKNRIIDSRMIPRVRI